MYFVTAFNCSSVIGMSEAPKPDSGTVERFRTVMLPHPIPIHIEYFTEFVDAEGALQDREDIYGIAGRVAGTIAHTSQD